MKIGESIRNDRSNIGRADIFTATVYKNKLTVVPSEPPKYHADIKNWPEEKSKQKLLAISPDFTYTCYSI